MLDLEFLASYAWLIGTGREEKKLLRMAEDMGAFQQVFLAERPFEPKSIYFT